MSLPLPLKVLEQHTIVLGKTRSGKSSKLRLMVEGLLDRKEPLCIIDPKGDWWGLKSSADGKTAGYPIIIFGGDHADVPINPHSGAAVAELIATENRPCIIDLGGWRVAERNRFFIEFAATLFKLTRGTRWLVIDECHNFVPKGKVFSPDVGEALHWGNRLASEGQGKGLVLLSASQRPQKVHNDYLTSHETLIACRVVHKADRDAIKDWVDGCGDPVIGKEMIGGLAAMQRPEAWVWSPEIGFGPKLVTFPLFSTYDSFKPQSAKAGKLRGWADVNLTEVKTKLEKVVEEARANDPAALKTALATANAEIAKLRKTANTTSTAVEKINTVDPKALTTARQEGFRDGVAAAGVTMRALPDLLLRDFQASVGKRLAEIQGLMEGQRPPKAPIPKSGGDYAIPMQPAARAAPPPNQKGPTIRQPTATNSIEVPLQRIVDAIKWWQIMGVGAPSHAQVGFIAGYSHKSGTWSTYLSRLRSSGLIEGRGDLALTAEGERLANLPDAPPTGEALRAAVIAKVDAPLRKILLPIFDAFPNGMDHASAGAAAGYSHQSGTWSTYLSRLRSLDVIEGRGELKAQGWLFP